MKTTWPVFVFGFLLSMSALAAVKVEVEYESPTSQAHTSALLDSAGDQVELFGSERNQMTLKMLEQEGQSVSFLAEMKDAGSKDAKPFQARLITLLGEDAEIKASDDHGKLLYRLKLRPKRAEGLKK